MADVQIQQNEESFARSAAEALIVSLNTAIKQYGQAVWAVAGGSTPAPAYQLVAKDYVDKVDWSKVLIVAGDERCVEAGSPDSNWQQVKVLLLDHLPLEQANKYEPPHVLEAEAAAQSYKAALAALPKDGSGRYRLDVLWLGIGEDGHTLSLFPGRPELTSKELVVAVHDAPKPPPERISLGLMALEGAKDCVVMVSGSGKAEIVARILNGESDKSLPVVQVANLIEAQGGKVTWLIDAAAGANIVSGSSLE